MEENVALDSTKQKKFVKSIKGIKKLIKKNAQIEAKPEPKTKNDQAKPEKPFSMRMKDGKIKKKKRKERGLVYLSHIPHGFYEHQMTQYFRQFGVVTNARVIKSERTGNSKGYAFVEFKEPSVAQIVAETMNNYLMGKRLIKAVYIPPEKQKRRAFRKHWNANHNPASVKRLKLKKAFNTDKDESGNLKKASKLLSNLNKTKKKLRELGINYDFFLPVDVPETLLNKVIKKEKDDDTAKEATDVKPVKSKKEKVEQKENKKVVENEKVQNDKQNNNKKANKNVKNEKENKLKEENKKVKQEAKKEVTNKDNKKDNKPVKVNEKQQKEKEQKLKDAGVKSVEEFISLDAEDSDDSCEFDSDEYEKMLEDDDDLSSEESGDEEGSEEDEDDSEDEEDEEVAEDVSPAPKKAKGKPPPKVVPVQGKKQKQQGKEQPPKQQGKKQAQKQQGMKQALNQPGKKQALNQQGKKQALNQQGKNKQQPKPSNEVKRKAPPKPPVAAKKPKFEKQNQKPLKKQFKKK